MLICVVLHVFWKRLLFGFIIQILIMFIIFLDHILLVYCYLLVCNYLPFISTFTFYVSMKINTMKKKIFQMTKYVGCPVLENISSKQSTRVRWYNILILYWFACVEICFYMTFEVVNILEVKWLDQGQYSMQYLR